MIGEILGAERAADVADRIIVKAEGNFFLEELSLAVRDYGADALTVPDTVQELILARIDRLAPDEKALLQCAAVVGKDVPLPIVQAIVDLSEDVVRGALGRLVAAEFVYETAVAAPFEYTFKHALIHEVVYASLLPERRRELHLRSMETIERLHAGGLDDHVERLAHHAFQGEVWTKALVYLRQAGARAASRSANREAATYYKQAGRCRERTTAANVGSSALRSPGHSARRRRPWPRRTRESAHRARRSAPDRSVRPAGNADRHRERAVATAP